MGEIDHGEQRFGDLVEQARVIRNVLAGIHSRYNRKVVEQAAILGVLNADIFGAEGVEAEVEIIALAHQGHI